MKKTLIILGAIISVFCLGAFAQAATTPAPTMTSLLMVNTSGQIDLTQISTCPDSYKAVNGPYSLQSTPKNDLVIYQVNTDSASKFYCKR